MVGKLTGHSAIGHTRYSTTGENSLRNVQPLFGDLHFGGFAVAHNGNLTNAQMIRQELVKRGSMFQSTSDTEVILHSMATHLRGNVIDRLINALHQVEGAYSLVCIADDMVIGVRDPLGVRPMVLGKRGDGWILASETCALDIVGADYVRDIEAGELIILDKRGVTSMKPFGVQPKRFCIFEYVYFARPDSVMEGHSVYDARKRIGAELAKEAPATADVVIPVPDSGVPVRARLCRRLRHPVRIRHHPQPLCRPHLHRADRPDPPSRRAPEAQRQPRARHRQAHRAGG